MANRDAARFCSGCGARLLRRCATCDVELDDGAHFCDACGAPVAPEADVPASVDQTRKIVTVLFADLAGSTSMQEQMDPESVRAFNARYYSAMRTAVEDHGGRIVKFVGDGVMAVFGVPEVAEDDAPRALAAAVDMVDAFAALASELRRERGVDTALRIGVNTGEVVVDEGDDDVVGDAVNIAARLEQAAPNGGILVGDETYRLTREHAAFEEPVKLQVRGRIGAIAARILTSLAHRGREGTTVFVGRTDELAALVGALGVAEATSRARLVTIVGSPGVGKSRLLEELHSAVGDAADVFSGRCDVASASAFAPVAEIVRGAVDAAGGVDVLLADDTERERVVPVIDALVAGREPGTPQETFWAVRRVIEASARRRPVVVVLDDLHWAEPLLLDLVEHLAEWLSEVPVLLVAAARPELRELRPALVDAGARPAAVLALEGLDAQSTQLLAVELLGSGALPPDVVTRIVGATEGNPLFVRELVRMLVDDGVLRAEDDGWVVTVDARDIDVPPTITSLLAARVERLRADERTVLERASVIGHEVYRGALVELLPAASRAQLDAVLESLRRKELLEPAGTYWIDEPVLRFHHALIRDAAYRRLLKEARADLHERTAEWLRAKTGGGPDHDEVIGFHLEQAQANRRELGPLGEHGRVVATEAATRLAGAAHRALHRDDLPAAATLSGRALRCVDADDSNRSDLLLVRCEALLGTGDIGAARGAVDELESLAVGTAHLEAWATAFRIQLATLTGEADLDDASRRASEAAAQLAVLGDPTGAAKAHRVHASVLARQGRVGETEAALERALTAAREAGDNRQISGVLAAAPLAALWGPSPVPRAGGRCLDVVRLLRITTGARPVEAIATRCQAVLEALRGRTDAARTMLGSARATLEDLGLGHGLLELELFAGLVELIAGDPVAAEAHLRVAYDGFHGLGIEADAAQAAALRARAALAVDDDERALALAETAEQLGGRDLKTAIAWRAVKAEVLARRGQHAEAIALARAATDLADPTDALLDRADAQAALAAVLAIAGDADGGRRATGEARALYEQKGATALMERVGGGPTPNLAVIVRAVPTTENSAFLVEKRACELIVAGRIEELREVFHSEYVMRERRHGFPHDDYDLELSIAAAAAMYELGTIGFEYEVLAEQGPRAAVIHETTLGDGTSVEYLVVAALAADGRIDSETLFDVADFDLALAELDRMTGAPERNENLATRNFYAFTDAMARGEARGVPTMSSFLFDDRRRGLTATFVGEVGDMVDSLPALANVRRHTLAVRGERLCLVWGRYEYVDSEFVNESISLVGTGAEGQAEFTVVYDVDDAAAAIRELDERYALGEGADHAEIVQGVAGFFAALNTRDWSEPETVYAPDVVYVDHRQASFGTSTGLAATVERLRTYVEVAPDIVVVARRIVELRDRLELVEVDCRLGPGAEPAWCDLMLLEVAAGRVSRYEVFALDDRAAALARVEELANERAAVLENQATRVVERWQAAFVEHRWDDLPAFYADDIVHDDRRSLVGDHAEGALDFERRRPGLADLGVSGVATTVIAVRGDRFSLTREVFTYQDAYELDMLRVNEINDRGQLAFGTLFDPDDLAAALALLDDRYSATLTPAAQDSFALQRRLLDAYNRGDLSVYEMALADDFQLVVRHQPGMQLSHDRATALRALEAGHETRHALYAEEVFVLEEQGSVSRLCQRYHNASGGEVDTSRLAVNQVAAGRVQRIEYFPDDQLAAALARYAELAASSGNLLDRLLDTPAARVGRRYADAVLQADFDSLEAMVSADHIGEDRRAGLTHVFRGRAGRIDAARPVAALGISSDDVVPLAVRGDRLALSRVTLHAERGEIRMLVLMELDESGLISRIVNFDEGDMWGAMQELDTRSLTHFPPREAAAADIGNRLNVAQRSGDAAAIIASVTDDFTLVDHQLFGRDSEDVDDFADITARRTELTTDLVDVVAYYHAAPHGGIAVTTEVGVLAGGGDFEVPRVSLFTVRDGKVNRVELFHHERFDAALARLEELRPSLLENRAVCTRRRMATAVEAHDVDRLIAEVRDDFVSVDHRGLERGVEYGRDLWRGGTAVLFDLGLRRLECTPIAVRGENLALVRLDYVMEGDDPFTTAVLSLVEVDDDRLALRFEMFNEGDLPEAYRALAERDLAVLPPELAAQTRFGLALIEAFADGEAALRVLLDEEFVAVDHRSLGLGVRTREEWIATALGATTMASRLFDFVEWMHPEPHGIAFHMRRSGLLAGGEFESRFVGILLSRDGHAVRMETFAEHEVDRAVARLDELRPSHLENRAMRAVHRMATAVEAQDVDRLVAGMRDDFVSLNHRALQGDRESDRDKWREAATVMFELGLRRLRVASIAVRGENLALVRLEYLGQDNDSFSAGVLAVIEVDDVGDLRALEAFDEGELPAACAALEARAVAVFPVEVQSALLVGIGLVDALHSREGAAIRACLTEDFESVDHRALGLGVRTREEWLASTLEGMALATNAFDLVEWVHAVPHGVVHLDHVTGLVGGGEVEVRSATAVVVRDGRVGRMETYAEEDLDVALARLAELAPER